MGFTIYYESARPVNAAVAAKIRQTADELNEGHTWLSCEPVSFFEVAKNGKLWGGSKPNFLPYSEDVAAAERESLPDGTVDDLLKILCQLSQEFKVDWKFSHEFSPLPIGFIRLGECEPRVLEMIEALGETVEGLHGIARKSQQSRADESRSSPEASSEKDGDDGKEGQRMILKFRPKQ